MPGNRWSTCSAGCRSGGGGSRSSRGCSCPVGARSTSSNSQSGSRVAATSWSTCAVAAGPSVPRSRPRCPASNCTPPTSTRWRCAARGATCPGWCTRVTCTPALPGSLRGRVNLLLVNAPYVPTGHIPLLPPEARDHEPRTAYEGGADGLDVHRRVSAEAAFWLVHGGRLLIEVGTDQVPAATALPSPRRAGPPGRDVRRPRCHCGDRDPPVTTVEVWHLDVFARLPGGGNPCPIVLDADPLTTAQMQDIAAHFGQESGFVTRTTTVGCSCATSCRATRCRCASTPRSPRSPRCAPPGG